MPSDTAEALLAPGKRSDQRKQAVAVCRSGTVDRVVVRDSVHQLLTTDVALDKLGARGISAAEVEQLVRNHHTTVRSPRKGSDQGRRVLLVGRTDGGRVLTLVIERTIDPTSWLIVTGWNSTQAERKILER